MHGISASSGTAVLLGSSVTVMSQFSTKSMLTGTTACDTTAWQTLHCTKGRKSWLNSWKKKGGSRVVRYAPAVKHASRQTT
jgi:hypothetical protein